MINKYVENVAGFFTWRFDYFLIEYWDDGDFVEVGCELDGHVFSDYYFPVALDAFPSNGFLLVHYAYFEQ